MKRRINEFFRIKPLVRRKGIAMNLLTTKEEERGRWQGYRELRYVGEEARKRFPSNATQIIRVATDDGESNTLFLLQRNDEIEDVASVYHIGERDQLLEFRSYDKSGQIEANSLFEQLLEGLSVNECIIASPRLFVIADEI